MERRANLGTDLGVERRGAVDHGRVDDPTYMPLLSKLEEIGLPPENPWPMTVELGRSDPA